MDVRIKGLCVDRGSSRVVNALDLEIRQGCWLGVVGANGSGKTSMLRALAGRVEVAAGIIRVDGVDRTSNRAWRAQAFGFAPDLSALPESLTGAALFAILTESASVRENPVLDRLRAALDFESFLGRRIGTLSTGMRQRLAIFCAFLSLPRLVILDEPFNWLDPVCAFDTRAALSRLVEEEGLTLVTALHEPVTLLHHCDFGLILSNGWVSKRLSGADLREGATDFARFEADLIASLRSGQA